MFLLIFFRERKGEIGRNIEMREKHQSAAPACPLPGIEPETRAPLSPWDNAQFTEPYQPGSIPHFKPLILQIPKYLWSSSETGSQHLPFGIQVGREMKTFQRKQSGLFLEDPEQQREHLESLVQHH
uniref:Uncharacterized protein n=1 Tax=Molossus molossus TaxID=27622 RepID=A0A7J8HC82_MOLMO|nr:hypothetical protein HJG59_011114 [Molossus molossus]